jgi:KDO2-lipid IV(A) lauroyltransferase
MRGAAIKLLIHGLSYLPLPLAQRVGAVVGWVLYRLNAGPCRIARINLGLCFPRHAEMEREILLRKNLMETGRAVAELGAMWLWPVSRVLDLLREVSGGDLLEQAMTQGRGVILVSPHLGMWEIIGLYASTRWPMTGLYRPPRMQILEGLTRYGRERAGARLVPTNASGVRALYKALGRGELVSILPDQDPDRETGVFAPFFGISANTMTLLPRLARKTGATVLITYAERLPRGRGYHLHIRSAPKCLVDTDIHQAAACLNRAVEECVRALPMQYQWTYKRFKTRPPGEARIY